jgi:hypothetical protein
MSWLTEAFGGGKNPADAAKPYLDEIPGIGHNAYDPYITEGQNAGKVTQEEFMKLLSDPTGFLNKLMEGYKTSEGYNAQKETLQKELGATAAAGGIAGTPLDQMNQGEAIQKLLSGDMQQFLTNVLGLYNTGLEGESGKENKGFQASGSLADLLGGAKNQQAGLAFQGTKQENENKAGAFSALAKALAAGAGYAAGGPIGGLAAGGLGSSMFGGG